jgi:hypothetical protein
MFPSVGVADFVRRMLVVLPRGWFSDPAPAPQTPTLLQAVLSGFGVAWEAIYALVAQVQTLTRIATVFGSFLDMASVDFFGSSLPRRPGEPDAQFRLRVQQEMLRPRATRAALSLVLTELTGRAPIRFEPVRPADTGGYYAESGGYHSGALAYSVAGGWGNLGLRHNSFITVQRPLGGGIPLLAGYGTGGYLFYGDTSMVETPVTDASIFAAIVGVLPAGHIAWVRIDG